MTVLRMAALVALASALPYVCEGIAGQEYHVNAGAANRVAFLSDAPVEDFEGVTDRIDGYVFLQGEGLAGGTDLAESELYFEVDLASLDTGLGLRNRHMRENYLETGHFPFATFEGRIQELGGVPGEPDAFRALARGGFRVHGVRRSREVECRVTTVEAAPTPEDPPLRLRVQCAFEVALSDHDIPIPKLMFMKIDEVMELTLDFYLTLAS